jgi:methionyl-tRNA formyltransferase
MQPWPTAFTFLHRTGQPPLRLTVQRVVPAAVPEHVMMASPGRWLPTDGPEPRLLVAAGDGAVEVLELQPAGKRRMSAAEFLRGRALHAGDFFGPETVG